MGKEAPADRYHVMRATRSLAYNRELKPVIVGRIERAEATIRGYLLGQGLASTQIGAYEIAMDEEGDISYTRISTDDWQQLELSQSADVQESAGVTHESVVIFSTGNGASPQGER